MTSEYGAETLRNITGSELYRGAAIAIIVGGSILVIIAFFGAIGAIIESKCLLGIVSRFLFLRYIICKGDNTRIVSVGLFTAYSILFRQPSSSAYNMLLSIDVIHIPNNRKGISEEAKSASSMGRL